MSVTSVPLEASQLHMAIVRNVTNAEEIFGKIKSGELKCGLVKATLLLDPFQLVVAANKASLARASGKMTTKSVYTETLYNLSPSRNISQSLSGFGADGKVGGHLVAFAIGELSELEGALMEIRGDRIAIEDLQDVADVELIRKTYGVKPGESAICPLLDSIVTRIGAKSCVGSFSIA